jgi:hypothetical protein
MSRTSRRKLREHSVVGRLPEKRAGVGVEAVEEPVLGRDEGYAVAVERAGGRNYRGPVLGDVTQAEGKGAQSPNPTFRPSSQGVEGLIVRKNEDHRSDSRRGHGRRARVGDEPPSDRGVDGIDGLGREERSQRPARAVEDEDAIESALAVREAGVNDQASLPRDPEHVFDEERLVEIDVVEPVREAVVSPDDPRAIVASRGRIHELEDDLAVGRGRGEERDVVRGEGDFREQEAKERISSQTSPRWSGPALRRRESST